MTVNTVRGCEIEDLNESGGRIFGDVTLTDIPCVAERCSVGVCGHVCRDRITGIV